MEDGRNEFLRCFLGVESALRGYILAHVQDADTAEEILQRTAIALWKKFDDYDTERPFLPWAIGMARVEIRNTVKQNRRAGVVIYDIALADKVVSFYEHSQTALDTRRIALRACVKILPEHLRGMLWLHYREGLPMARIGEKLGKSIAAVKVLFHRTRMLLRECIEKRLKHEVSNG